MGYLLALIAVFLGTAGQVYLKSGVNAAGGLQAGFFRVLLHPHVVLGFLLYGISSLVWLGVLSRLPLSNAYPLLALNFVLILVFAVLFLGEPVTAAKVTGVLLIFCGMALTAF